MKHTYLEPPRRSDGDTEMQSSSSFEGSDQLYIDLTRKELANDQDRNVGLLSVDLPSQVFAQSVNQGCEAEPPMSTISTRTKTQTHLSRIWPTTTMHCKVERAEFKPDDQDGPDDTGHDEGVPDVLSRTLRQA